HFTTGVLARPHVIVGRCRVFKQVSFRRAGRPVQVGAGSLVGTGGLVVLGRLVLLRRRRLLIHGRLGAAVRGLVGYAQDLLDGRKRLIRRIRQLLRVVRHIGRRLTRYSGYLGPRPQPE